MKPGSSEDSDCSLVHMCADGGSPLAPGFLIKLEKKKLTGASKMFNHGRARMRMYFS